MTKRTRKLTIGLIASLIGPAMIFAGCKHKDDQNKIEYGKVSPCIFCVRSAHDNYEREDSNENSSQKAGT